MKCHYKLQLPRNPLNEEIAHKILKTAPSDKLWYKNPHWHTFYEPEIINEVLSKELKECLHSVGLDPSLIVVFFITKEVTIERSFVHKDCTYIDGKWVSVPFGINFEINPTTVSTTTWWNTEGQKEYYDDNEETRELRKHLMGFRFHENHLRSTPKYLKLDPVDEVTVEGNTTPLLFRTDVAHSVLTSTKEGVRYNVSIRFNQDKIKTFDEAVERLQPLIIGSQD